MDTKLILVRRLEICMACKLHYIVFPHALFEPVADRRSSQIVELTFFDSYSFQNSTEILTEVVDHLQSRIRIGPLAFDTKLALDVIVPRGRHKNIRTAFGLLALLIDQELCERLGQRQGSAISVCAFSDLITCTSQAIFHKIRELH